MMTRDQILQSALQLPPEDRAFVASALEHSIGSVNRRGETQSHSFEEVIQQLWRDQEAETPE